MISTCKSLMTMLVMLVTLTNLPWYEEPLLKEPSVSFQCTSTSKVRQHWIKSGGLDKIQVSTSFFLSTPF